MRDLLKCMKIFTQTNILMERVIFYMTFYINTPHTDLEERKQKN